MYIKLINGSPINYSIGQLLKDNSQTSFPSTFPDVLLAQYSVYLVQQTPAPVPSATEVVEDAGVVQREDGSWAKAWAVRPMTEAELAADAADKDNQRRHAYTQEADPLFFKWQRGEATQQQWLDKIAEIKARYCQTNEPLGAK